LVPLTPLAAIARIKSGGKLFETRLTALFRMRRCGVHPTTSISPTAFFVGFTVIFTS